MKRKRATWQQACRYLDAQHRKLDARVKKLRAEVNRITAKADAIGFKGEGEADDRADSEDHRSHA